MQPASSPPDAAARSVIGSPATTAMLGPALAWKPSPAGVVSSSSGGMSAPEQATSASANSREKASRVKWRKLRMVQPFSA
ncbi:MAG: hypothetical protein M5R40_25810 [Anaerolineae bacterium]|nr:hypothetical protein [Anaerolineae bacterium]